MTGTERGAAASPSDLRFVGVSLDCADPAELAEGFAAEHERRYGYRDPDAQVELVNVRLALVVPGPAPQPEAAPAGRLERSARRARFGGAWTEAEVLRGEPRAGAAAEGPCVFELPEATLVLPFSSFAQALNNAASPQLS